MNLRTLGLTFGVVGTFGLGGWASAQSSFTIDLSQVGSDVVATGSGTVDTSGLTLLEGPSGEANPGIDPGDASIILGASKSSVQLYQGFSSSSPFGSGSPLNASGGTGDSVVVDGAFGFLGFPTGYESGAPLSDTATFSGTTLADLGVTPGTYTFSWGDGGENTITLYAGVAPVPEPSDYGFALFLATGLCLVWKRAKRQLA